MANLELVTDTDKEQSAREEESASFDDFWLMYPKRVAKMEAQKSWSRMSSADRVACLVGLVAWRPVWLREGRLQFVPNASTWLNQQRWTDELPETWGTGSASHQPAKLPERGERSVMPDHVRTLLAKLRNA